MTSNYDIIPPPLGENERNYLANLVRADAKKKRKSINAARRHGGQTEGDFAEYVDGLRSKLAFQDGVLAVLEDDEAWEGWDE